MNYKQPSVYPDGIYVINGPVKFNIKTSMVIPSGTTPDRGEDADSEMASFRFNIDRDRPEIKSSQGWTGVLTENDTVAEDESMVWALVL